MQEPFGKRNRRVIQKPQVARTRTHLRGSVSHRRSDSKVYLYAAGGVLFLILLGYAFA